MISVMLVDDHALIREGLRRAVDRAGDMTVVGEAQSVREAMAVAEHVKPDVAVVDIRLPDGNGVDLCRDLRDRDPARGVVVLTMYGDSEHLLRSKDAGASAFVSKDAPAADVVTAIRQAAARPDDFMADGLAEALAQQSKGQGTTLTKREQEVLGLLADGLGVAGISKRLYISESTTKTHVAKIYAKLGASNRAQALMTAIRKGLVSGQAED